MNKVTPSHGLSWYVKWLSTIILITAGAMAAVGTVPENFLLGAVGMCGMAFVGFLWHD